MKIGKRYRILAAVAIAGVAALLIILTSGHNMADFTSTPSSSSADSGNISPEEFRERFRNEPGTVIDVRTPDEVKEGHLEGALHSFDFLSGEFDRRMEELDKEQTYYLYCRSGNRSGKAMEKMRDAGFKRVYNIGGYEELVSAGAPSVRPDETP